MKQDYNPRRQGRNLESEYKRTRAVIVRLNTAEHHFLKRLAKQSNLEVAAYLRQSAFVENVPAVVNIPEINKTEWLNLGRALGNFNQCVRHINNGAIINGKELEPVILIILNELKVLRAMLVGKD